MHQLSVLEDLSETLSGYHERFELSYHDQHILSEAEYTGHRTVGGDAVRDIIVNVALRGKDEIWTHKVRSVVLDAGNGSSGFCAIILDHATEAVGAETRLEKPSMPTLCRR